jgi:hypothetical protein
LNESRQAAIGLSPAIRSVSMIRSLILFALVAGTIAAAWYG